MITQEILNQLAGAGLTKNAFKSALQTFSRCNPEIHDIEFLAASVAGNFENHEQAKIISDCLQTLLSQYSRPDYIINDVQTLLNAYPII